MRKGKESKNDMNEFLKGEFRMGEDFVIKNYMFTVFYLVLVILFCTWYFGNTLYLPIHLGFVSLLFYIGYKVQKKKVLFKIAGWICLFHLLVFPFIYLYFSAHIADSFRFDDKVFNREKTELHEKLMSEEANSVKDEKLLSLLLKDNDGDLAINFRDISNKDSLVFGEIVIIPQLINLEKLKMPGGGGAFPPSEKIILRMKEGSGYHEYILDVRRGMFDSSLLLDMLREKKKMVDAELDETKLKLKNLVEKNDIWSYDTLINYSIKIFLFDSPMTPHVGLVNQVYMAHLVVLMILSSMFFHELNKD